MNLTNRTDILNIFLIVISFILAINIPFKLFLFSYAVLGPLHYLTEINWLNSKNFFVENKKQFIWIPITLGAFITAFNAFGLLRTDYPFFEKITTTNWYADLNPWVINSIFIVFIVAIIFTLVKGKYRLYISLPFVIIISAILGDKLIFVIVFGVFLPTIIHVYFFTAFFMLYGALKSNSKWGIVSFFVLLSVTIILFFDFSFSHYIEDKGLTSKYVDTNFHFVNFYIANLFTDFNANNPFQLTNNLGLKIQSFIAFAYTYHYLNWFTKTTTIKWHLMKTKNFIVIICLWIFSVALYYIDYKLGLVFLLYLSFLHVFLEFPLNALSIKGIFQHLLKS